MNDKFMFTLCQLLEPESKMYTMLRRASRRGSMFSQGPESATEGLRVRGAFILFPVQAILISQLKVTNLH